jgi:lysozyme
MRHLSILVVGLLTISACSAGPENVGTTSEALTTVCGAKPSDPVQGRDVSIYQGNFDWQAQKNAGVDFGYARISDGLGSIDSQFANNWSKMKAAGVLRGAYQFFEPGQDPVAQANMMVQKVGGMLGAGDLPCMIDVEATGGQSPGTIASRIQTWLDIVEKGTGRTPFIYTGAYFWQDYVQSANFGKYPLWIANYGATCPLVPNGWKTWLMWQYSDGGGSLDHDVFNGTLGQLQGYAAPPNTPPHGDLNSAGCKGITGWAQDEDTPKQSIDVHLYFDGPQGKGTGVPLHAGQSRMDLCAPLGSCDHGFAMKPPRSLLDAKAHDVYAYAIDSQGGDNPVLKNAPKMLTCEAPALDGNQVRRWVTSQASLDDWKFSRFLDVAPYSDAALGTLSKGQNLPLSPTLAQADDGTPAVWVLDNLPKRGALTKLKRHVVDWDSLVAWRFDPAKIVKMKAADLGAIDRGPDWPAEPDLVQGSGPEVDMLDVSPDSPPPPPVTTGGGDPNSPMAGGDGASSDHGGCNTSGSSGSGTLLGLALALLAIRKRRR